MIKKLLARIRKDAYGVMLAGLLCSAFGTTGALAARSLLAPTASLSHRALVAQAVQPRYGPTCSPSAYGKNQNYTFFSDVLGLMHIPQSQFALDAFSLWELDEGAQACWNPLATTYRVAWMSNSGCGETIFNSAGVRNYSSKKCGELATADTLIYSQSGAHETYEPILDMLRLSSFNNQAIRAALVSWCGGGYASSLTAYWQGLWDALGGKRNSSGSGGKARPI